MRAAYQPEAFGIVLSPDEMDVMVEVFRMHVRDYEVDEQRELMLEAIEEAYAQSGRERAGGRPIGMGFILDAGGTVVIDDEDDEDGGAAVVGEEV